MVTITGRAQAEKGDQTVKGAQTIEEPQGPVEVLSAFTASAGQPRVVLAVSLFPLLTFPATAPFARLKLAPIPSAVVAQQSMLLVVELITVFHHCPPSRGVFD